MSSESRASECEQPGTGTPLPTQADARPRRPHKNYLFGTIYCLFWDMLTEMAFAAFWRAQSSLAGVDVILAAAPYPCRPCGPKPHLARPCL